LDEKQYWVALEFRVSHELAGTQDNELRFRWCDGFMPGHIGEGCIVGSAWMADGQKQEQWDFELHIGDQPKEREKIDWKALLPGPGVTGWLSLDLRRKTLKIIPANAHPDEGR
jgi:hypothetical protein